MFEYRGQEVDKEFIESIELSHADLPIVGESDSDSVLLLAHYSDNPSITKFTLDSKFSWTSRISDDPETIEQLIGMYSHTYKALYLLKLGLRNGCMPRNYECQFMKEYAIDLELQEEDFSVVRIYFDDTTSRYKVS